MRANFSAKSSGDGRIALFAAKEQAAFDKTRSAYYAASKAVDVKIKECMERMGGKKDKQDWYKHSSMRWGNRDVWQEKDKACNALVDQQNDEVVKYIYGLITEGTVKADTSVDQAGYGPIR
jgi:hypothetical protein